MKFLKKPIIILIAIVFLASFLYTFRLGKVPPSLDWDEVSLGYNAYSILKTGKDEYGKFLPLVLRSYDDYKPALYAYFAIPFVGTLGLTEIAVRLPSVVAGVGAVVLLYFLILELLNQKEITINGSKINATIIALLASFLLAISPWHIQFSRVAFEANVGVTINLAAFLLFLKGLKRGWLLPVAFAVGALNIHMYQSDRVFTPMLLFFLSAIFYKDLLKVKKWFFLAVVAFFIVALPFAIYVLTDKNALLRAKGVSVFSSQDLVTRPAEKLLYDNTINNKLGIIFDNRRIEFVKAVVYGYISHFDLNWLFITGDIARQHAPFMGLLYIFELPFLLVGIYMMVFLDIKRRYKFAFFTYFLLVPIPASVTSGVPHAVRTMNFQGTFELFIALGIVAVVVFVAKKLKSNKRNNIYIYPILFIYLLFTILNIGYYFNQYFVQLNYFDSADWLYGYKQAIAYIGSVRNNYDKVVVENEVPFDQSYMFFLFYMKVDPSYYQSLGGTNSGGFKETHKGFYNITFMPIKNEKENGKVLLMGKPSDIPVTLKNRKVIYFLNGEEGIAIADK